MHGETCGNPGKYLYGILILTVAAAVTVLIWGGNYALLAIVAHGVAKVAREKWFPFAGLHDLPQMFSAGRGK